MKIKTIGSGSKGNCYYISDGTSSLLIEAGVQFKKLQIALNFKFSDIVGCLVTHEHGDHSKYIKEVSRLGIKTYSSAGTFKALKLKGQEYSKIEAKRPFNIGTFKIMPFDTQHDCSEPLGFIIYSEKTKEKLLFGTDTFYIKYKFSGLTHIMLECNYSEKTLDPECPYTPRLIKSHFSLENVIKFMNANDLSLVKEIHLMHLSEGNSDGEYFKKELQKATGKLINICGE